MNAVRSERGSEQLSTIAFAVRTFEVFWERIGLIVSKKADALTIGRRRTPAEPSSCGDLTIELPRLEISAELLALRDAHVAARIFEQRLPRLSAQTVTRAVPLVRFTPVLAKGVARVAAAKPAFGPSAESTLEEYKYTSSWAAADAACESVASLAEDMSAAAREQLVSGAVTKDVIQSAIRSLYAESGKPQDTE